MSNINMAKLVPLVAHRGASQDALENTLAAFQLAWEQGAEGIEGDFHLTQDGQIVCVHDEVLYQDGHPWRVAESTLVELQQAFPFIPTLEQVLDVVPAHKRIVIEIKCGIEIVTSLLESLRQSGLSTQQVMLIAFNADVIALLKVLAPQWTVCWLVELGQTTSGELTPSTLEIIQTVLQIKADGVSTFAHPSITPHWVQPILDKGLQWHVWTVDDVELGRHLIACGVQSITTNRPQVLRQGLGRYS
jgi:glycerophosphoryl diester phosphodiesterase